MASSITVYDVLNHIILISPNGLILFIYVILHASAHAQDMVIEIFNDQTSNNFRNV